MRKHNFVEFFIPITRALIDRMCNVFFAVLLFAESYNLSDEQFCEKHCRILCFYSINWPFWDVCRMNGNCSRTSKKKNFAQLLLEMLSRSEYVALVVAAVTRYTSTYYTDWKCMCCFFLIAIYFGFTDEKSFKHIHSPTYTVDCEI